jgi:hypothetical protein
MMTAATTGFSSDKKQRLQLRWETLMIPITFVRHQRWEQTAIALPLTFLGFARVGGLEITIFCLVR